MEIPAGAGGNPGASSSSSSSSAADPGATVWISNLPATAVADELFTFFNASVGSVYACKIAAARGNWRSRGHARVQFQSAAAAAHACRLAAEGRLGPFQRAALDVRPSDKDIVARAADPRCRAVGATLHVGVLKGERAMVGFAEWEGVRAEVMPERKKFEVFVGDGAGRYKLEVMYGDVVSALGCRVGGGEGGFNAVLLQLNSGPRIYQMICRTMANSKALKFRYQRSICEEDFEFSWVRATDFSSDNSIGKSSYLCLQLAEGSPTSEILRSLPCYGELGNLDITKENLLYSSKLVPIVCPSQDYPMIYEVIFQLNSLIHSYKISYAQMGDNLFDTLSKLSPNIALEILQRMHRLKTTCYEPMQFIETQLAFLRRNQKNSSSNAKVVADNLMSCHRVLVTPTKVYFLGPELEENNYVVKHFSAYASDFLRVSFVEEDRTKLPSDAISMAIEQGIFSKPFRTSIYDRILSILKDGISIGSKKFEFLSFSASQLRANSVWMFASNGSLTAESIRQWMGKFRKIRSVSKCAARMGQQFSSSMQTLEVPRQDVKSIPDVEVTTDGIKFCFSDGIGKISLPFARQVARKCGLDDTPSAFQIRYGGYKGVVAVDRKSFQKLSLRPSMLKFDSNNKMLNVTSWTKYLPCFLNREIICLLSTLGIEDGFFESLQHEQMHILDKILAKRDVALMVLEKMTGSEMKTAINMLLGGYEPNSDPYLWMMLNAYREYQLSDIRSKCRILVPKGRVLLGCLDETGTLNYGQVYVRVTMTKEEVENKSHTSLEKIDQTTAVIVGKVVVTKNPCLHPGDIRVLQAAYEPKLIDMGLVDCIVFPQKGKRPHPNECSGGDLDGDLFFVCWDENLIPLETDTPMDYTGRRPRLMDHEVKLEEIQKFFVDYMINDTLGVISTTHLVHADRGEKKARGEECIQLAKLHSMAVDFAKTGAPAEMPRKHKPKEFPDFMERWDRPMYESTGVLGKLYRAATSHLAKQNSNSICSEKLQQSAAYDSDLEVEGFEAFLGSAKEYYDQYAEKFSSLMRYYGAEHEDEMLTGNLRIRSIYLQRDKRRYAEVKERILIAVKCLHGEVEGWFKSGCGKSESARMASAWYHVTYHPNYHSKMNFLSFPWIVSDVLLMIKASRKHRKESAGSVLQC